MLRKRLFAALKRLSAFLTKHADLVGLFFSVASVTFSLLQDKLQVFPKIQETALIVQTGATLTKGSAGTIRRVDASSYIIRSKGSAELSVILSGRGFFDYFNKGGSIPQHYSHDIAVCNRTCDFGMLKQLLPPVLAEISFTEKQSNFSLLFSKETPLDLIIACGISYGMRFSTERRIGAKGHPYVEVGLPKESLKATESLLDSLNRMENVLVHGQMLFKRKDGKTIPVTPLFISSFLSVVPIVFGSFTDFSLALTASGVVIAVISTKATALLFAASSIISNKWTCAGLGVATRILILLPTSPDLADEYSLLAASAYIFGFLIRSFIVCIKK